MAQWMHAGVLRCGGEHGKAMEAYARAASMSSELPELTEMVGYDHLWSAILALDFAAAAETAAKLKTRSKGKKRKKKRRKK